MIGATKSWYYQVGFVVAGHVAGLMLAHDRAGERVPPVELGVVVGVDDLDRAIAFYRDALGLRFLFEAPPQMAFFDCGGIRLLVVPHVVVLAMAYWSLGNTPFDRQMRTHSRQRMHLSANAASGSARRMVAASS